MDDYRILAWIVHDRRRAALQAAEAYRLAQPAHRRTPGVLARCLAALGGWLVTIGTRLQAQPVKRPRSRAQQLETI